MEKTLRVLGGGEEDGHSHSHSHDAPIAQSSGASVPASTDGLRARTKSESKTEHVIEAPSHSSGPSKLSAYLNLFGDFVHNM